MLQRLARVRLESITRVWRRDGLPYAQLDNHVLLGLVSAVSKISESLQNVHLGVQVAAVMKAHSLAALTSAAPLQHKSRPSGVSVFATSTLSKNERQAKRQPREENVGLESKKAFYVDHTCIGEYWCTAGWLSRVLPCCNVRQHTHCCLKAGMTVVWTLMVSGTLMQTATHAGGLHQSSLAARMSSQPFFGSLRVRLTVSSPSRH